MKWVFPIYNQHEQLVMRLSVRISNYKTAERKAEDYVEKNKPHCWISYSEAERVLDEIEVQEVEI
jgi:hypothetical protein